MDMDSVVSTVQLFLQSIREKDEFRLKLSSGEVFGGVVHPDWRNHPDMLGRTLDLTAAYQQLAVDLSQNLIRALVAHNPDLQSPA